MLVVPGLVFGLAHKGIARAAGPSRDNFAFDDTPPASRGETGVLLRPGEEEPAAAAGVSVTAAVSAAVPAAVSDAVAASVPGSVPGVVPDAVPAAGGGPVVALAVALFFSSLLKRVIGPLAPRRKRGCSSR